MAVLAAALALSACTTMQIEERNFIRPDRPGDERGAATLERALPAAFTLREESIAMADGVNLRGVSLSRADSAATVLYFGGNAFHLDQHGAEVLAALAPCRVDLTMFDYRGYGRSGGVPDVATMKADALREFDLVDAARPGRVIVHGQSLGSFIAAYVAQQRPVRALVLESTTTNALDWANANVPWYARPFITVELSAPLREIDNVATLAGYNGASLLLTGEDDRVTPLPLARKVLAALPGQRKRLLALPGAGHNNVLEQPASGAAYCDFVRDSVAGPAPAAAPVGAGL
ncbi:alpha/beta fold hydrolase [Rugamonas sp. CCM 8940]|nr:alpha/beta fold hydrolase [Rugamonas sp. CCM 8940]